MYKGASRALQHAHGVDRPHPSRGYIDGEADAHDVLPDPATLSKAQLLAEQRQLRAEVARAEQELTVAKTIRDLKATKAIGERKAVLSLRLSAVNKALAAKDGPSDLLRFMRAAREIVGDELTNQIVQRAKQLRQELASGTEARSDETEGLGPQGDGPAPKGDAQP